MERQSMINSERTQGKDWNFWSIIGWYFLVCLILGIVFGMPVIFFYYAGFMVVISVAVKLVTKWL